jgi:hypothetical protein
LGLLEDSYTAGSAAAQRFTASNAASDAASHVIVTSTTTSSSSSSAAAGAAGQLEGSTTLARTGTNPHTPAAGSSSSSFGLLSVLYRVAAQWLIKQGTYLFMAGSNMDLALAKFASGLRVLDQTQQVLNSQRLAMHKQLMDLQCRPHGKPGSQSARAVQLAADKLQAKLLKLDAAVDSCAAQRPVVPAETLANLATSLLEWGSALSACATYCHQCGSSKCSNLGTVSELFALVRGRACVCRGCLQRGVDPAFAKR